MNKRQRKKFEKKGCHRKCLGPDEIVFLGVRLKKLGKVRLVCNKSEITPVTPDQIRELGNGLRRMFNSSRNAFKNDNYNKFLTNEDDENE